MIIAGMWPRRSLPWPSGAGGAVLLGVDDQAQAVELAASDPRQVLEKKG